MNNIDIYENRSYHYGEKIHIDMMNRGDDRWKREKFSMRHWNL